MDSISYVYISWTIHGMWMIYITFETRGPKFSNTTARALAYRTAVQQRQLRAKWLLCSTRFFCVREVIKTESATAVQRAFRLCFNIQPPTRNSIRRWNVIYIIFVTSSNFEIWTYEIEPIFLNHAVYCPVKMYLIEQSDWIYFSDQFWTTYVSTSSRIPAGHQIRVHCIQLLNTKILHLRPTESALRSHA